MSVLPMIIALGLVFGSFVTALSYRLPRGQSIAKGRSACPACGTTLTARDLVPVFSWIANGGRCRHCSAHISWRYPAIEVVAALLFAAAAFTVGDPLRLGLILAVTPIMMTLATIDLEHRRLPNSLLVILVPFFLAVRWSIDRDFVTAVITCIVVFVAGVMLDAVGRRLTGQGLGMGDTKLMAAAALALPPIPFLIALGVAGVLGASVARLPWAQRHVKAGHFPFGVVLLVSFWVALISL